MFHKRIITTYSQIVNLIILGKLSKILLYLSSIIQCLPCNNEIEKKYHKGEESSTKNKLKLFLEKEFYSLVLQSTHIKQIKTSKLVLVHCLTHLNLQFMEVRALNNHALYLKQKLFSCFATT